MVALCSDRQCEGTAWVHAGTEAFERVAEVVLRLPSQVLARGSIDVDAIDTRQHRPAAFGVQLFELGKQTSHDARCVGSQISEVVEAEGGRGADDVTTEADRTSALQCQTVGVHGVFYVHTSVEQLVDLRN